MPAEVAAGRVYHFSEDGGIRRFAPHVPATNPGHPPAVWVIDERHAPLYWFPRDCPRLFAWADDEAQRAILRDGLGCASDRLLATESGWLPRLRATHLHRYVFDIADFTPWPDADGQYVSDHEVTPIAVEPLDDLLGMHVAADVELRLMPRLGPLRDAILASGLPFSFVRMRNAIETAPG